MEMNYECLVTNIVAKSIKVGVFNTLNELGLLSETVSKPEAERLYNRKLIQMWREKNWITGYPSKNKERAPIYFKRSELETASLMTELGYILEPNIVKKLLLNP